MKWGVLAGAALNVQNGEPGQRTVTFGGLPQLSTLSVRVEPFGAQKGPIQTALSVRLGKRFEFGTRSLDPRADILNALNNNAGSGISWVSGSTYGQISTVPSPRSVQLGAQFVF